MNALPSDLDDALEPRFTGISCPECAGCLMVEREGRGNLRFICRVGHTQSVDELLAGKEEKIEADLWASVRGLEELVALLVDLEAYALRNGRAQVGGPHGDRIAQARDHARNLRQLIARKRPVDLTAAGDGGVGNDGPPAPPRSPGDSE